MNIHLPAILGFTRYQGFDSSPYMVKFIPSHDVPGNDFGAFLTYKPHPGVDLKTTCTYVDVQVEKTILAPIFQTGVCRVLCKRF